MGPAKSGFTILETALVLAIATLLFMSVVIGFGGRIAVGRYETASNEIADYLRDVYSEVLNVENNRIGIEDARDYCTLYGSVKNAEGTTGNHLAIEQNNDPVSKSLDTLKNIDVYPGRTACAIYGKIIFFGAKDGRVHVFDVVGDTVTAEKKLDNGTLSKPSDLEIFQRESKYNDVKEQLDYVRADYLAEIQDNTSSDSLGSISLNSCRRSAAASHDTYEANWGALFKSANNRGEDFIGFIMIVRAPASGNVQTFFYEAASGAAKWDFEALLDKPDSCPSMTSTNYDPNALSTYYAPLALLKEYDQRQAASTTTEQTGFCIGSDDFYIAFSPKKYLQIVGNGQNASAVKLNSADVADSRDKDYNPCL